MPTKQLPASASIDHLKHQAKDLIAALKTQDLQAAQRVREFHPRFRQTADAEMFTAKFSLSDAQLTIAREYGYPSWMKLRKRVEAHTPDESKLPHHLRIKDAAFRRAVDLLDAGDAQGLREYLRANPGIVHQRVNFDGGNYFRNPSLLEFSAENPIRRGYLNPGVVAAAKVVIEAGAGNDARILNETLGLVSSGRVPRECGVQVPLIDLLCDAGADANEGIAAALVHGEFEAVERLLVRGARMTLPVAAALGRTDDAARLLSSANAEDRHRALAFSAQFGHIAIVRLLIDAGEDINRYNPPGAHSHSTPLHQAALAHFDVVKLLVEQGARLDLRDTLFQGRPVDWAKHAGNAEVEQFLRARDSAIR